MCVCFGRLCQGGKKPVLKVAGADGSKPFKLMHDDTVLKKYGPKLAIGRVAPRAKL